MILISLDALNYIWADSPQTARAEVKKWEAGNGLLTFWSYDDGSSLVPTVYPAEYLRIIDGVKFGFDIILKKIGNHETLTCGKKELGGVCFLFFEQRFRKLSLREVSLRPGSYKGKILRKQVKEYSHEKIRERIR